MKETITYINLEHIHPHPENPRKELGDLTELVESIKKNGIMQNLTVIPMEQEGEYMAIIGHRRSAAAKLAGITEVPCRIIEGMSLKEQVSTMLEENMQRNDLTIFEQAQGFQMMLDLGETEEGIAEKTGFSRSTIRRRLNIAKLDPVLLKKKEQDDSFQLTLKDLYELDKIEDVKTRNKILNEAASSRDIAWKAKQAAIEEKRKKAVSALIPKLEEKGVKKAPKSAENERWSGKWEEIKGFELDKDIPEEISYKAKKNDELFYVRWYDRICIIRKAVKSKKETQEELERKERDRKIKQIKGILKNMDKRRREFVLSIIEGKIAPLKEDIRDEVWNLLIESGAGCYRSTIRRFLTRKNDWEIKWDERTALDERVANLNTTNQMLIILSEDINGKETVDYCDSYKKENGAFLKKIYELLKRYGWSFEEGEEEIINGTSELYKKENEK